MKSNTSPHAALANLQQFAKPLSAEETSSVVGGAEHLMSAPPAHCVFSFPARPNPTSLPSVSTGSC